MPRSGNRQQSRQRQPRHQPPQQQGPAGAPGSSRGGSGTPNKQARRSCSRRLASAVMLLDRIPPLGPGRPVGRPKRGCYLPACSLALASPLLSGAASGFASISPSSPPAGRSGAPAIPAALLHSSATNFRYISAKRSCRSGGAPGSSSGPNRCKARSAGSPGVSWRRTYRRMQAPHVAEHQFRHRDRQPALLPVGDHGVVAEGLALALAAQLVET